MNNDKEAKQIQKLDCNCDLDELNSPGLYTLPEFHEPEFIDPDPITMAKLKAYIESGQYMRDVMRKVEERKKG